MRRDRAVGRGRLRPFAAGPRPDWFPDWRGETAAVIASGPSVGQAEVAKVQGKARIIAVNTSYRLAPWADALYACDAQWWRAYGGAPDFRGLKITQDAQACIEFPDLRRVSLATNPAGEFVDEIVDDETNQIGSGKNSGFQALNLAIKFGAKRVLLFGFDFCRQGGLVHHHGDHPAGLRNPPDDALAAWAAILDAVAPRIAALGVDVVNVSPVSALSGFRKAALSEVL